MTALVTFLLCGAFVFWWNQERTKKETSHWDTLTEKLNYAARLETQLEDVGAQLVFRHVPASANAAAHQELVLVPGPSFKANDAYVNRATGQAWITFPPAQP